MARYRKINGEWFKTASDGGGGGSSSASDITYDNSTSGMTATNVQDAIDEQKQDLTQLETEMGDKATFLNPKGVIVAYPQNPSMGQDYIATQDCMVIVGGNNFTITINGVLVYGALSGSVLVNFQIKEGTKITFGRYASSSTINCSYGVYEI